MTKQEIFLKIMELEASEIEKALPLFNKAKEVVQAFDGKIYNDKLKKAFEVVGLCLHRGDGMLEYTVKNDHIHTSKYTDAYIRTRTISLSSYKDVVKNKRIDATVWCQLIDSQYNFWQKHVDDLRKDIKNCLETIQEMPKMTNQELTATILNDKKLNELIQQHGIKSDFMAHRIDLCIELKKVSWLFCPDNTIMRDRKEGEGIQHVRHMNAFRTAATPIIDEYLQKVAF